MKEINQFSNFLPNYDERIYYRSHGNLESSAASFSVMHVIAHELRHLAEFRAKAREEGAEIRNEDVDIHYEIRNGRLVAVGGVTRVTTAKKTESEESEFSAKAVIQDTVELTLQNKTREELQEKLNQVQSDLNLFLVKRLVTENEENSELDNTKDDLKIQGFERLKEAIKQRLAELNEKDK